MAKGHLDKVVGHLRVLVGGRADEDQTDGQLLERFVSCKEEAPFAALVQRHGGVVLGVCRRVLGDEHDAEDAFQATFLVLAKKAGSIRKRASVGSWLYGVAYRIALREKARAARRRAQEQETRPMSPEDPLAAVVWRELRPVLDEELSRLPDKYRDPVVLCYLENMTNSEAARRLGWTKGTVSGRLARAREILRGRLARRGVTVGGGLLAAALGRSAAASVPASLGASAVKAAALAAAGQAAAAAAISTAATAMAEGVLHTMLITKIKMTAAVLMAASVLGGGVALVTHQVMAQKPTDLTQVNRDRPAATVRDGSEQADRSGPVADEDRPVDATKLQKENEMLKKELERTRQELEELRRQVKDEKARMEKAIRDALREAEDNRQEAQRRFQIAQQRAEEAKRMLQLGDEVGPVTRSANNLKHIGIAFHSYHDTHQKFPAAAIPDKDGKPLLSWRVAILPWLEQHDLYRSFKLDEPWDSPHNKKLLAQMPAVYAPVKGPDREKGLTFYQVFVGKGTVFEGNTGIRLLDIRDGTSNTILAVEAANAVPWTKPEDLPYSADKPLPKLGGMFKGGFNVLLADGSVHFVKKKFDEKLMRLAITRNDDQPFEFKDLEKE
jgi:RNA polymerase sigma factor (sigma-70 family)